MKWFPVDSDSPDDPKIKAVIRRGVSSPSPGQAAAGAVFLLWCFVANHGHQPGAAVGADGQPLPLQDLADACEFGSVEDLRAFLDFLAERRHIDPERWTAQGIVFLPAMHRRLQSFVLKKRTIADDAGPDRTPPDGNGSHRKTPDATGRSRRKARITVQDSTTQHSTSTSLGPDGPAPDGLLADNPEPDQVTTLVAVWNIDRQPGPIVRTLTPSRRDSYARAVKLFPDLAQWRKLIAWLNSQPWCNADPKGKHPTWRADLDWLVKPANLAKYMDRVAQLPDVATPGARDARRGITGTKAGTFARALNGTPDGHATH